MVGGDWYFAPVVRHTGAVYLNDRQLYEAETLEECIKGEVYAPSWEPEWSVYNGIPSRTKRKIRRSSTQISRVKTRRRKSRNQRAPELLYAVENRRKLHYVQWI